MMQQPSGEPQMAQGFPPGGGLPPPAPPPGGGSFSGGGPDGGGFGGPPPGGFGGGPPPGGFGGNGPPPGEFGGGGNGISKRAVNFGEIFILFLLPLLLDIFDLAIAMSNTLIVFVNGN